MRMNIVNKFKVIYLISLGLLFISIFLEWYSFQIYNLDQELIASWHHNIWTEWRTFSDSTPFNDGHRPEDLAIPLAINIVFVVAIILSGYIVLFRDIEQTDSLDKFKPYGYILGCLLCLNIFFVVLYPVVYLFPNGLYSLYLQINDYDTNSIFLYSFGPGYILQLIVFPFIFSYTVFYIRTITTFQQREKTPEKIISQLIEKSQEPLDLDKLLAQEELKSKFTNGKHHDGELEDIMTKFIDGD